MTTWLTVAEAAAHIRAKSPRMIRDAIDRGEIPAVLYGKSAIRIDQAELDNWLRAKPYEPRSA
jgi:excisionase family DNA binding protein